MRPDLDPGRTAMAMATLQEQARALGDPTRHAIFQRIAHSDHPLGIAELNEHFPFNHNAIRQHLAKLVAAQLVVESTHADGAPGRPRLVYVADPRVAGRWGTIGPFERLSRLLAEIISTGDAPVEVGRRAAEQFRAAIPTGDAVTDLAAAMTRQGFEPEVRSSPKGTEIVLRHCPFASTALIDRRSVCELHLGIADGLVRGSEVNVDELVAYDPRKAGCRVRVSAAGEADGSRQPSRPAILSLRSRQPKR